VRVDDLGRTSGGLHRNHQRRTTELIRGEETYGSGRVPIAHKRVKSLLGESQSARLATQVCKLDPHLRVLGGGDDEGSHFEDALPDVDVALASLESVE
jgi:hypothetical protein